MIVTFIMIDNCNSLRNHVMINDPARAVVKIKIIPLFISGQWTELLQQFALWSAECPDAHFADNSGKSGHNSCPLIRTILQ